MAGLLFLAFAYLAVGQAAANRSDAQTAADAAALAAAQKTRDQLAGEWLESVLDPTRWGDIFDGDGAEDFCWRAGQLASQNDAQLEQCGQPDALTYTVQVRTNKTVGDSVVPGTENTRSKASARATIEPLCTFETVGRDVEGADLPELICKDRDWQLKPDDLADLPGAEDLFDVHLAD